MRKVQIVAVSWTMLLAIPMTALVLSGLAYATEHLTQISTWSIDQELLFELVGRPPEVIGMIAGQAIIMLILVFARKAEPG